MSIVNERFLDYRGEYCREAVRERNTRPKFFGCTELLDFAVKFAAIFIDRKIDDWAKFEKNARKIFGPVWFGKGWELGILKSLRV